MAAGSLTITLDTNCLIDLAEARTSAKAIKELVAAHSRRQIELAITAVSAAERQPGGSYIGNFAFFRERLRALGLDDLVLLKPIMVWGMAFWDWCVFASEEDAILRSEIGAVLFPNLPPYEEHCRNVGYAPANDAMEPEYKNKALDALILHTHIRHGRAVFVTSDRNFHKASKKPSLIGLGAGNILCPEEAVAMIADQRPEG